MPEANNPQIVTEGGAATRDASHLASSRRKTVHELFEEVAARTPDIIAIRFQDQEVSYSELNQQANRLAHYLVRLGVTPGALIGLCMERSPEVIVGLLAILKVGGAYVPLDPTYPDERLGFIIRDTGAPLVLSHRPTANRLVQFAGLTQILNVDAEAATIAAEAAANLAAGVRGEDVVYVMYTSGSTGLPKGVLTLHRGVVRLVRDTDYCRFGPEEVFLHLAPLAFDASTFEIWGPLLNGSCLALLPPVAPTPDELDTVIRRYGVTTLWLTAGLFHLVVEQRPAALGRLGQLVAGGDVLSPKHVRQALEAMRDGVLINGYGPTESTTFACCYRMTKSYHPGTTTPIGKPIAHTTAYVLDERLHPVPVGTPGELYIGGDGLARGYLNNPELTQEKFISDPFSSDAVGKLYRTGDRVRCLADGNLEFIGRLDSQIKIMGHRVEPGEIEATLCQHPVVHQAVVITRTLPAGEKQLLAYVVAARPHSLSTVELKRFLADRLPPYMVPAQIVPIDYLPLNANGKVDRSHLPAPERAEPVAAHVGSPLTEMEDTLLALWRGILDCSVGLDENFFDLGGTSLQLLQVHAELRRFAPQLSMTELFEHTTVRSLAGRLAGRASIDATFRKVQDRAQRQKAALARQKRNKA
jgi:amino acid adenylation domain-containing protein